MGMKKMKQTEQYLIIVHVYVAREMNMRHETFSVFFLLLLISKYTLDKRGTLFKEIS